MPQSRCHSVVWGWRVIALAAAFALGAGMLLSASAAPARAAEPQAPWPMLTEGGKSVDWWFVFKFNSSKPFARCDVKGERKCPFGGTPLTPASFGQQFVFASSENSVLTKGKGCLGAQLTDPVGATFNEVFRSDYYYVLWNDQFYGDPRVCGRAANCNKPWGHSKGMLAWNHDGNGFIMQVTTPSWPGSGSVRYKRAAGNTLGCVSTNNNLRASQHFFALRLDKADLIKVLDAMRIAGVATNFKVPQVVFNGGPKEVRDLVFKLGTKPSRKDEIKVMREELSIKVGGKPVILIAKPAYLSVPPWQYVSALLKRAPTRAATWWTKPKIPSSRKSTNVKCWDTDKIKSKPGPVEIALSGEWNDEPIKLYAPSNHAKIGVASMGKTHYEIFGDMNQQGSLSPPPPCDASQNGRGGMFFVLQDDKLYDSMRALIAGDSAPLAK